MNIFRNWSCCDSVCLLRRRMAKLIVLFSVLSDCHDDLLCCLACYYRNAWILTHQSQLTSTFIWKKSQNQTLNFLIDNSTKSPYASLYQKVTTYITCFQNSPLSWPFRVFFTPTIVVSLVFCFIFYRNYKTKEKGNCFKQH